MTDDEKRFGTITVRPMYAHDPSAGYVLSWGGNYVHYIRTHDEALDLERAATYLRQQLAEPWPRPALGRLLTDVQNTPKEDQRAAEVAAELGNIFAKGEEK